MCPYCTFFCESARMLIARSKRYDARLEVEVRLNTSILEYPSVQWNLKTHTYAHTYNGDNEESHIHTMKTMKRVMDHARVYGWTTRHVSSGIRAKHT